MSHLVALSFASALARNTGGLLSAGGTSFFFKLMCLSAINDSLTPFIRGLAPSPFHQVTCAHLESCLSLPEGTALQMLAAGQSH